MSLCENYLLPVFVSSILLGFLFMNIPHTPFVVVVYDVTWFFFFCIPNWLAGKGLGKRKKTQLVYEAVV